MTTTKKNEIQQLRDKLLSNDIDEKFEAIRRIIDAMTRGKDVSMLFTDVIKNMQTPSVQLKKLIYLYVMSYAKSHPDLAIMGVNTFRKDAVDKKNPFLRGLAVRTMGCIRIKDICEYLCGPLKDALKDQDSYVRKTGALCVPKLYQISPALIQKQDFLKQLEDLLNDGNAQVVSNAVVSLIICGEIKGQPLLKLTDLKVQRLLTAMKDCNQWGVIYILDTLSSYIPKDPNEAEGIMERVSSRLNHTNSAVTLSAIRLIIKYMDYLSHPESIRAYNNKISTPLITMISRENQISYIVLKTMNLVLQKRPLLLPKELKIFFVNYHDPLYVKLEKLEILAKIANNQNILMILHELKQCVQQVDVEFVRKAVQTMGRCAIKLDKMADKCVQCLWETLKTKIPYVVQEAVIVIRDIFRKYPNKYEGLLADICQNLKSLDDPEAKASIVWIIGEYVQMIENADQIMANFADNFKDQSDVVQQQILVSCVKLYLHKPTEGQEILKDLFKYITKECQNPDLRDRGLIYWRLLSTNPELAKKVVLSERPLISEQSYTLQTQLLDKLIENIGTLSSVYCKLPEQFVKKLKDNANAREILDEDAEELLAKNAKEQNVQFFGEQPKQNVTFANKNDQIIENKAPISILDQEPIKQPENNSKQLDLIDITEPVKPQPLPQKILQPTTNNTKINPSSLLDIDLSPKQTNPIVNSKQYSTGAHYSPPSQTHASSFSTNVNNNVQINFFDQNKNIVVPMFQVVNQHQKSRQGKYSGISIKAAFQKQNDVTILQLNIQNRSQLTLENIMVQLRQNFFQLHILNPQISDLQHIGPGQMKQANIQLINDVENSSPVIEGSPYTIEAGIKILDDIFFMKIPAFLFIGFNPNFKIGFEDYRAIIGKPNNFKKQENLDNKLSLDNFIQKLTDNNMTMVFRKESGANELMSFACELVGGMKLIADIIFEKQTCVVLTQLIVPSENFVQYFSQALRMIIEY